jgi:Protein of unknown function (DUF5818)
MKAKCAALLSSILLASFPSLYAQQSAQQPAQPQLQAQTQQQSVTNTFAGKITKKSGKYVLEESASKDQFVLDNQEAAKKYNGRVVVITGTINIPNKTIHVEKIEAAV